MVTQLKIHWPVALFITAVLYILTIVCLPFNQTYSTLFMFAIISFWSRLPGVGIPSPMLFLYFMDVIDFFSVIISINIGGMAGGVFSLFINMSSRLCCVYPEWIGVTKDSLAQFISCLLIPVFLPYIGNNIEYGIIFYTIARTIVYGIFRVIPDGTSPVQFWVYDIIGITFVIFFINIIYARLFGQFFNALLQGGVSFNWFLFIGVTIAIIWARSRFIPKEHNKPTIVIIKRLMKRLLSKKEVEDHKPYNQAEITNRILVRKARREIKNHHIDYLQYTMNDSN